MPSREKNVASVRLPSLDGQCRTEDCPLLCWTCERISGSRGTVFGQKHQGFRASLVTPWWRICLPVQERLVQSLGLEDPLQKEMATHSSILTWEIPWTEMPGSLLFMGSQRVRQDLVTKQQQQSRIQAWEQIERGPPKHLEKAEGRNVLSPRREPCLHAWFPLLAPFPSWWGRSGSEERGGGGPLAVRLLVTSCFQQLCPSSQGVTAGTSGNEMISRASCLRLCRLPLGLRLLLSLAASEFTDIITNVACSSWPTRKLREDMPVCHERGPLEGNVKLGLATIADLSPGSKRPRLIHCLSRISHPWICQQVEIPIVHSSNKGAFFLDRPSVVGEDVKPARKMIHSVTHQVIIFLNWDFF